MGHDGLSYELRFGMVLMRWLAVGEHLRKGRLDMRKGLFSFSWCAQGGIDTIGIVRLGNTWKNGMLMSRREAASLYQR